MPTRSPRVKPLALALLVGCAAPQPKPPAAHLGPEVDWTSGPTNGLADALRAHPEFTQGPSLRDGPRWARRSDPPADAVLPDRVLPEAVGARSVRLASVDVDRGAAIEERLDELPRARVDQWGLGALTGEEIFGDGEGTPGLCEDPGLTFEFSADGVDYEMGLEVYYYTQLIGDPEPMFVSISNRCTSGLAEAAGDVDAAVEAGDCAEDEARTFFEEGSTCRECVEAGGDYAACQDTAACPDEAPLAVWVENPDTGEKVWYRGVYAVAWGCAPDLPAQFYFMADMRDDGVVPRAFDHTKWAYLCTPLWNDDTMASDTYCVGSEDTSRRGVLAEGMFGYVDYLRPAGEDVLGWRGRQYYVDEAYVDTGRTLGTLRWFYASNPGLGAVSATNVVADTDGDGVVGPGDDDYGYGGGGFGFDPGAERPDGESYARDWLAGATVKTATTIDGVSIVPYQHNRCAEWEGPGDDGTFRCVTPGAPVGGWINDLYVSWSDTEHTRAVPFPMTTLASTGGMDPDVPGGYVTHIASSPALALPGFDACTLPHTFTPDVATIEDLPLDYGGLAPLDAQTWRFDKDDNTFRVALATNRARGWCGGDASGGGRSVLDAE